MKIKFPSLDKVVSKHKSLPVDNIKQYIAAPKLRAQTTQTYHLSLNL